MSDAKQRTAKPGDLLSQWWTLGAIAADRRTTGRHMKAGWVIINSYWQKHGNGRASLSYIQRATGMDRKTVIKACRELDEWGHAARATGVGSRPSEYVPRWVTTASGVQTATTGDDAPSGVQMTTGVVAESTLLDGASGVQMTTESYLPEPAYLPASGKVDDDCAAPSAPPVAGLSAATAGTAQEGLQRPAFEALWHTYAHAKGKKEAKAAWDALPAEVDRAAVIKAAAAWQASWAAQGKPDAPRKHLATWLREERYDEDAPKGFQKLERSKAKPKPAAKDSEKEAPDVGRKLDSGSYAAEMAEHARRNRRAAIVIDAPRNTPLTVLASAIEQRGGDKWLELDTSGGRVAIVLESSKPDIQDEGQARFGRLCDACGVSTIDNSADLHGFTFMVVGDTFAPAV